MTTTLTPAAPADAPQETPRALRHYTVLRQAGTGVWTALPHDEFQKQQRRGKLHDAYPVAHVFHRAGEKGQAAAQLADSMGLGSGTKSAASDDGLIVSASDMRAAAERTASNAGKNGLTMVFDLTRDYSLDIGEAGFVAAINSATAPKKDGFNPFRFLFKS